MAKAEVCKTSIPRFESGCRLFLFDHEFTRIGTNNLRKEEEFPKDSNRLEGFTGNRMVPRRGDSGRKARVAQLFYSARGAIAPMGSEATGWSPGAAFFI